MHWMTVRARSGSSPERAPYYVLLQFQVDRAPVPVEQIVRGMGVPVDYVDSPGWSGAVRLDDDGTARIWVSATDVRQRKQFTIAHELGHLMLHMERGGQHEFRDGTFIGDRRETQANIYAANLLMPEYLLEPHVNRPWARTRVETLARIFDVSEISMRFRLSNVYGGLPESWA